MRRSRRGCVFAVLLCVLMLFGSGGCGKNTQPAYDPEPTAGGTTDRTDYKAPKEIRSKDISDLCVSFYLNTRWNAQEDHLFQFEVKPDEKGALTATELLSGAGVPADKELLDALQTIIDQYGLVSLNGTNKSNLSLSPEFQGLKMTVNYASGERLFFTDINDPASEWAEEMYDVFADRFSRAGDDSLYPQKETSTVSRIRFDFVENGLYTTYGGINVKEEKAIDGETYLLEKMVNDTKTYETIFREFILFPEDYYERITEIIAGTDLIRRYDFSYYDHEANDLGNHDRGYYGMGKLTTKDEEPDSEDLELSLYLEYESGNRINIETRKASEIEGMRPLISELSAYYDSLFE